MDIIKPAGGRQGHKSMTVPRDLEQVFPFTWVIVELWRSLPKGAVRTWSSQKCCGVWASTEQWVGWGIASRQTVACLGSPEEWEAGAPGWEIVHACCAVTPGHLWDCWMVFTAVIQLEGGSFLCTPGAPAFFAHTFLWTGAQEGPTNSTPRWNVMFEGLHAGGQVQPLMTPLSRSIFLPSLNHSCGSGYSSGLFPPLYSAQAGNLQHLTAQERVKECFMPGPILHPKEFSLTSFLDRIFQDAEQRF